MERCKEKKSENSLLLEQTVQKKNWPTFNLLNIIENSSLIWNDRNKDIENYKPISFTSKPEVAHCVRFPVVVFEMLNSPREDFCFASIGTDLTQRAVITAEDNFYLLTWHVGNIHSLCGKNILFTMMRQLEIWQWSRYVLVIGCMKLDICT